MSRWDVQDGLVHFVFANEDAYVQDSMVVLNLTDKLYFELRRRRYEKILFLEGLKGDYILRLFDMPSWQFCYDSTKKMLGYSTLIKDAFQSKAEGQEVRCSGDQILKLLSAAEDTACVFMLHTFAELFQGNEKLYVQLLEANSHRKNLILLRAGVSAEDSQAILTAPNGIFLSSMNQEPLFPEVRSAFLEEDYMDEGCYNRLNNYMNNRCVFLNRFSKAAVLRVVEYVAWMMQKTPAGYTDAELRQIARFVWLWYHEEPVQEAYRSLFSDNEERKFSVLAKDLNANWHAIAEIALEFNYVNIDDRHIHEPFVISHNKAEKQIQAIRFREEEDEKKYGVVCRRLVRNLQRPRQYRIRADAGARIERFIARMNTAALKDDFNTFDRAEKAVRFAIRCHFSYNNDNRLIWDSQEKILESSANLFEMEASVQQYTDKIARLKKEQEKLVSRIRNHFYSSELEETVAKEKVIHIVKSDIPTQEKICLYIQNQIKEIRHLLQQLESAVALTNRIAGNDTEVVDLMKALTDQLMLQKKASADLYAYDFMQQATPASGFDYNDPELFGAAEVSAESDSDDLFESVPESNGTEAEHPNPVRRKRIDYN